MPTRDRWWHRLADAMLLAPPPFHDLRRWPECERRTAARLGIRIG